MGEPDIFPNAKIPTVALPVAEPPRDAELADVPHDETHPENVYLLRVDVAPLPAIYPNANMPTVPAATGVTLPLAALNADGP